MISPQKILQIVTEALGEYERNLLIFSANIMERGEEGAYKTLVINRIRSLPGVITVSYKKKGPDQFIIFIKFLVKAGESAEQYRDTILIPGLKRIESLKLTGRSKIQSLEKED